MNQLGNEKSPYLLQHKDNPVHWYPWGEDAFKVARAEDKPIFLSVGYSTCYWCHVMEKDSFEQAEVAEVLNNYFISIKVDREERPDVDEIYMDAVLAMTGQGGWPMSVFLTPDGKPFYGGTYFPRKQFVFLLNQFANAWKEKRDEIESSGEQVLAHFETMLQSDDPVVLQESILQQTFKEFKQRFDSIEGGFGEAPKFPPSMAIRLLFRMYHRSDNAKALAMATLTLDKMACGGLYDQIGGGFHRYSTDADWLVPHFEKMLYDNALLAVAYTEGWQITGKELYRLIVEETLTYMEREMRSDMGGFYSAQDAGEVDREGEFYVWKKSELAKILTADELATVSEVYGVSGGGNFENQTNILNIENCKDWEKRSALGVKEDVRDARGILGIREKLLAARLKRTPPHKDDKILTAWNGLTISAFAKAGQAFQNSKYRELAEGAASFIQKELWDGKKLKRRYRAGDARIAAIINDYAFLIQGLIDLYELTYNKAWLDWARSLQSKQDELLWDESEGGYFTSPAEDTTLIYRKKDINDGAIPAGNSISAMNLQRLYSLTLNEKYKNKGKTLLEFLSKRYQKFPSNFAQTMQALDFYLAETKEVAIISDEKENDFVKYAQRTYLPNQVTAAGAGAEMLDTNSIPLLWAKKKLDGEDAAYVCQNHICQAPTKELTEFKLQLKRAKPLSL